ncbi:cysteine desulfurase family protein [Lentibacillus halophilus]|uniref:cysteine desulfurase n=1 Tax=Lentibacillus halophilus TaxID=295065 RepID=A0ABN0ZCW8_9BACI
MERIYMDHAATTPMDKRVAEAMTPIFTEVFGNPSSVHAFGRLARQYLDSARRTLARSIQAREKEMIFTSGGTEADNLAIIGTAMANRDKGNHIITTMQEHHAVLDAVQYLEEQGFHVTYLPVNETGIVSVDKLKEALTDETIVVSVMYVNNETGVIQPIEAIGSLLKDHQAMFHTDAVQAFGLLDIDVNREGIDMLSASAHKINGPNGIGVLYAGDDIAMASMQFGGEQERKRRPGTENIPAAVGFKRALELAMEYKLVRNDVYEQYKQTFLEALANHNIRYYVNGDAEQTVPSIVNISFPGTNVETLLTNFDLDGVAASSGSACTAGSVEPSHVLAAMFGRGDERITNSIRFSFGAFNTIDNVSEAADRVAEIIKRLTNERRQET